MYTVKKTEMIPQSANFIFINKKSKKYIHVDLNRSSGKMEVIVSKSDDAINLQFPVTNDPVVDALPQLSGNLITDSLTVIKYFKANGFKLVDTITSTENGVKLT